MSPVSPCSTIRGREVQPLAALYPTVRLSPWRQVRKNIHSSAWTPRPPWSVVHLGGPPLLVPLSTGGNGPHPLRLAALYPTVRLSPWRQVRKNIHSSAWTPRPTWTVLHPGGPPLLVPPSTGGNGPHPQRLIRTPVQGGYAWYHSILSPPRRASPLVPLPLDLSASLPPEFLPIIFCVFSVWYLAWSLYAKQLPIGRVY